MRECDGEAKPLGDSDRENDGEDGEDNIDCSGDGEDDDECDGEGDSELTGIVRMMFTVVVILLTRWYHQQIRFSNLKHLVRKWSLTLNRSCV